MPTRFRPPLDITDELINRFESKFFKGNDGCWEWNGPARGRIKPYAKFQFPTDEIVSGRYKWAEVAAQRAAYQIYVGPIPDGYEIDHLCFNTLCVNPEHLEAVTTQENLRRRRTPGNPTGRTKYQNKKMCPNRHRRTDENTAVAAKGYLVCKICRNESARRGYERRRLAKSS